ncbi:hypothetical protein [Hymenobacter sp. BT190]|uniref:hypothetical protein n=1 Tax=Hymenobacter sp. BT190 TaxID=2763505 RepID=UPI0016517B79|nr:hypothetical protein [Hymenobacter sp. BT190]MBC6698169.1 hypothetical protein [Hymenobacter sp. BT190]
MKLHLVRRHRRPLLFPPGLLALAWLLWLGCVALPQMRGMERPESVMQITAVPVHTSEYWQFIPPVYSAELQLAQFRQWQSTSFSGNSLVDYFGYQQSNLDAERLRADSTYRLGLKISFDSDATYGNLVSAIDLLDRNDITTWWLDFQPHSTALYAFKNKPKPYQFLCGTSYYSTHLPELYAPFSFPLAELLAPDWRNSTLLLLLMALLSAVRLGRRWWLG